MKFSTKVKIFLWLVVILGVGSAFLDYTRMTSGEKPLFCIRKYDERNKIEKFRGIFYVAERTVKLDTRERLELSSNISYRFLNQNIKIKVKRPKDQYDFVLLVTPAIECPSPSKLYYEFDDKKVYLDCVISIQVKETEKKESVSLNEDLEKNPTRLEDIIKYLSYVGKAEDKKTEKFITIDDSFSNKSLVVYQCHNNGVKDIYITRNKNMAEDYCKLKNDTLKKPEEKEPELEQKEQE